MVHLPSACVDGEEVRLGCTLRRNLHYRGHSSCYRNVCLDMIRSILHEIVVQGRSVYINRISEGRARVVRSMRKVMGNPDLKEGNMWTTVEFVI